MSIERANRSNQRDVPQGEAICQKADPLPSRDCPSQEGLFSPEVEIFLKTVEWCVDIDDIDAKNTLRISLQQIRGWKPLPSPIHSLFALIERYLKGDRDSRRLITKEIELYRTGRISSSPSS